MRLEINVKLFNDLGYEVKEGDKITINGRACIFIDCNGTSITFIRDGKELSINCRQVKTLI